MLSRVMWQALSSDGNRANLENMLMLPFEGRTLVFSYVAALGAYTLLTKTAGLLAVVWAVSEWSWAEILGSVLCALAAVVIVSCLQNAFPCPGRNRTARSRAGSQDSRMQMGVFRERMAKPMGRTNNNFLPGRIGSLGQNIFKKTDCCNISRTFICYTALITKGGRAMKRILIVEDDALLNKTLAYNFGSQGPEEDLHHPLRRPAGPRPHQRQLRGGARRVCRHYGPSPGIFCPPAPGAAEYCPGW